MVAADEGQTGLEASALWPRVQQWATELGFSQIGVADIDLDSAEPGLQNSADGYAPQPAYRPLTKFENRGIKLGHGVWDLVFLKK